MCGLIGILSYRAGGAPVDRAELIRIRDAMAHRGPDGSGIWISPDRSVGLAHRRLAVIDVSETGRQPMASPDGRLSIVFNGEIYNFRELRSGLEAAGHKFFSASDTEVLLHLYSVHRERMVEKLRGMYAFAIWDQERDGLFLARDPFGIKPLYYSDGGGILRFASEVKALLRGDGIDTSPEPAGHVGFMLFGNVPEPHTLFRGISALPAGHWMWVKKDAQPRITRYFSLANLLAGSAAADQPCGEERQETLRAALLDSLRHHFVADVPVGLFLSSGIDSSVLAALAAESGHGEVRAITLRFAEYANSPLDEAPLAVVTARHYGIEHDVVEMTRREFQEDLEDFTRAMDQPSIDGLNTFWVSRAASRAGLKVVLSGLGGDELFRGYSFYRQIPRLVPAARQLGRIPGFGVAMRNLFRPLLGKVTSPKYASLLEYGSAIPDAYFLRRALFLPWEIAKFVDRDLMTEGLARLGVLRVLADTAAGVRTSAEQIFALEMNWYLKNQLLRDADWAGMANSVEIRVPYVDIELVRKVGPLMGTGNPFDKKDTARTPATGLPQQIMRRQKTGFAVPVRHWLMEQKDKSVRERGLRGWAHAVYHAYTKSSISVSDRLQKPVPAGVKRDLPLVSIVTPSFNQDPYIEETIQSVLRQTYPNIEYIVIDGASRDESVNIIKRFESRLAFWSSESDGGQSDAINKGFRKASGALVGWINSDDYLEPNAVERIVGSYLQNPGSVLFHGRVRVVDENGRYLRLAKDHGRPMTYERLLNGIDHLCQPGSFYRRDVLEKVGFLDESLRFVMDYDLWLRLLKMGNAEYIPAILANYRVHKTTKTNTLKDVFFAETFQVQDKYGGRLLAPRRVMAFAKWAGSRIGSWQLTRS
jgi:asparagine synthase (glutamine-hydrolysing)